MAPRTATMTVFYDSLYGSPRPVPRVVAMSYPKPQEDGAFPPYPHPGFGSPQFFPIFTFFLLYYLPLLA